MHLSENNIIELAILGVCYNQQLSSRKIITVIKNLIPEMWVPTGEVVMSSIERFIGTGYLKISDIDAVSTAPYMIQASNVGKLRLEKLLLSDPGEVQSPTVFALEIMQMCLLDLVNDTIAESVLARIRGRLQIRLSDFRQRSKKCLHAGQYTNLWFLLETRRLETSVYIIDQARGEINSNKVTQTRTSGTYL